MNQMRSAHTHAVHLDTADNANVAAAAISEGTSLLSSLSCNLHNLIESSPLSCCTRRRAPRPRAGCAGPCCRCYPGARRPCPPRRRSPRPRRRRFDLSAKPSMLFWKYPEVASSSCEPSYLHGLGASDEESEARLTVATARVDETSRAVALYGTARRETPPW